MESGNFHSSNTKRYREPFRSRKPGSHLSDAAISRILWMHDEGFPQREIAVDVQCSQATVSRITRQYQFQSFVTRQQRTDQLHVVKETQLKYPVAIG